jgi:hypothetical protein
MIQWTEKLKWLYPTAAGTMKSRLEEYHFLKNQYLRVCNELRKYARISYKKDYYLLRSIPSV